MVYIDAYGDGPRLLNMDDRGLTDQLWARLEPLIPPPPRRYRFPGRRRTDHRAALEGILFAVRTGDSSRAARSTAATTSA